MQQFWRNNGLSLVLFAFFAVFLAGQTVAGWCGGNDERTEHGQPQLPLRAYLTSGAFLEATMENWESEFLQMSAYVMLTVFLFQKGSSES